MHLHSISHKTSYIIYNINLFKRHQSKLDPLLLQDMLSRNSVWHDMLAFDDIGNAVSCFITVLEGLLYFLVPLHKTRVKQNFNPWASSSVITAACHH